MASIDEILAQLGLHPGVQAETTVSTEVSSDSSASTSYILAYSFGSITFAVCGGLGYFVWRYRHTIRAFLAFRSILQTDAFIDIAPRNSETLDLELGHVGLPSTERPINSELTNQNLIEFRPPNELVDNYTLEIPLD